MPHPLFLFPQWPLNPMNLTPLYRPLGSYRTAFNLLHACQLVPLLHSSSSHCPNFLVLVFSRIRSKPMWTLGKVDYAWVRPYWYPAFYSPSWTYHFAKGTHQPTYLLILGCEWTDRWSRSCSWCWFFENELSLSLSLQPGVQMLNISQSNDPTEKAQCRPCFPRLYGKNSQ